jgi:hypothetical protein
MTQTQDVLKLLEHATHTQQGQVCGQDFLERYIPRYSARIYDLREQGHAILTEKCTKPHHYHQSTIKAFRLVPQEETLF